MKTFVMDKGELEVGEASDEELAVFSGPVSSAELTATLENWMLIALRRPGKGRLQMVAVGRSSIDGRVKLTTPILAVDGLSRVRTLSGSAYVLGVRSLFVEDIRLEERLRACLRRIGHES